MLYIKSLTPDGKETHTPLDSLAIYSKCPICGIEHTTSFYELLDCFEDSGFDVDVDVWCERCSKEVTAND